MKSRSFHTKLPERSEFSDNPVKLCHEISHLSRNILRASCDNDDIMSAHGTRLVVSNLAIKDGVTQLDLVNATHLRASTISVILKNLEDAGIVERKRDENDYNTRIKTGTVEVLVENVKVLGVAPKRLGEFENIFVLVFISTCISIPIIASKFIL